MPMPRAAYTWEELPRKVSVTTVTETAAQVARKITKQDSPSQNIFQMTRAQFRKFQVEFVWVCKHPPARLFAWTVSDTLYAGCCDCGKLVIEKDLK